MGNDKIVLLNKDSMMMEAYIRRGDSEIHWEGEKVNHFELIKRIKNEHPDIVRKIITQVKEKYNVPEIRSIIENVDIKLPERLSINKLPSNRKEFVIKLITLRIEKLMNIIQ